MKTAHKVIEMREILDDMEIKYTKLMTYSPEIIAAHVQNAEGYEKQFSSSTIPFDHVDFRRG